MGAALGLAANARLNAALKTPKVAFFGNSYDNHGTNNAVGSRYQHTSVGWQYWLPVFTGGRVDVPIEYDFGVTGARSSAILAQLPALLATDASIVICPNLTVNDARAGQTSDSFETSKANIDTVIAACRSAGKYLILGDDPGIGWATATGGPNDSSGQRYQSTQLDLWNQRNRYYASLRGTPLLSVVRLSTLQINPALSTGDTLPKYSRDSLHMNQLSALLHTRDRVAPIINSLIPAFDPLPTSGSDAWSATNTGGNLNPNPTLIGTNGTISAGTGVTSSGTMPTSTTLGITNGSGLTITASQVPDGDYTATRLVLSGQTASAAQIDLYQLLNTAGLVGGSKYRGMAKITVADGSTGIQDLSVFMSLRDGSSTEVMQGRAGGYNVTTDPSPVYLPNVGWSGPLITPVVTAPTGVTYGSGSRMIMRIGTVANMPISLTVDISRMSTRQV